MRVSAGRSFPLGATAVDGGVNLCVFSRDASQLDLLLFDDASDAEPAEAIRLDAHAHRTYRHRHAFVSGFGAGQDYAYRAIGFFDPAARASLRPRSSIPKPTTGRATLRCAGPSPPP
jgi:glycogen operon protein